MMCWTQPTQKPKQNPLCVCTHVGLHIKKKKKAAPFLGWGEEYGVRTSERTLKLICCASSWAWGSTGWRSLLGVSASRAVRMEQPHISQQKSWDLDTKKKKKKPHLSKSSYLEENKKVVIFEGCRSSRSLPSSRFICMASFFFLTSTPNYLYRIWLKFQNRWIIGRTKSLKEIHASHYIQHQWQMISPGPHSSVQSINPKALKLQTQRTKRSSFSTDCWEYKSDSRNNFMGSDFKAPNIFHWIIIVSMVTQGDLNSALGSSITPPHGYFPITSCSRVFYDLHN